MTFRDFGVKEWMEYYELLNGEKSVDELRYRVSDDVKKAYNVALEKLKTERKQIPGVRYEINYHDFE